MRGNIAQLMQQAQKMQEDVQRAQEEVAALEATGNAGGGMSASRSAGAWTADGFASIRPRWRIRKWPKT